MRWLLVMPGLLLGSGRSVPAQTPTPPAKVTAPAPEVELVLGPPSIPVTGFYSLAFRLRGAALEKYSPFPELEGFKKSGKTSTTTTRIVQGRSFTELTITQRYVPYGEGEYSIKPFQLVVNGVTARSPGGSVRVGAAPMTPPAATTPPANPQDALQAVGDLDKLFGKPKPGLYQETPDHAFMAVMADQPAVFVGQGVKVGLYFFLAPADQDLLAFHDFSEQVPRLLRLLHQPTAWESPAAPPSVTPDTVRRQGQLLLRFRISEAMYGPGPALPAAGFDDD
jgi:hypothetical protein